MGFKDFQYLEPEDFLTEEEHDYLVELVINKMHPRNGGISPPGDIFKKLHRFMHRPGIPLPQLNCEDESYKSCDAGETAGE